MLIDCPSAKPYQFGFTAAALAVGMCRSMAGLYLEKGDWKLVREAVLESNLLQQNRGSSSARMEREIRPRLETMTRLQLQMLADAPDDTARPLAMIGVFKRYPFIYDFCVLSMRPKVAVYDSELRPSDFENFVGEIEARHPEVRKLTSYTRYKVHQVMVRILAEAGILSGTKSPVITPPIVAK